MTVFLYLFRFHYYADCLLLSVTYFVIQIDWRLNRTDIRCFAFALVASHTFRLFVCIQIHHSENSNRERISIFDFIDFFVRVFHHRLMGTLSQNEWIFHERRELICFFASSTLDRRTIMIYCFRFTHLFLFNFLFWRACWQITQLVFFLKKSAQLLIFFS